MLARLADRSPVLLLAVLAVLAFTVYSNSFHRFSVIDDKHSVLADADAANYVVVVRDFSLGEKLGNEYNTQERSVGDAAQKHKIHHVLYGMVGSSLYRVLDPAFQALGHPPRRAIYAVNAAIACLNLLLLSLLLRRVNPHRNAVFPFLVLYAAALSTWVYSSVPESWPFSATLVIAFLLLLTTERASPPVLGILLGIILLNNIFLAALMVPLAMHIRATGREGGWLRRTLVAGTLSVATWAAGLTVLSRFDDSFRPDHFIRYTLWFRGYADPGALPLYDPYVWKSASTNLLVTSFVSNQGDPSVPQEALALTLQQSVLGTIATVLYLAVAGLVLVGIARVLWASMRAHEVWDTVRSDKSIQIAAFCAAMLVATVVLFYASGFLYSTVVVPPLVVLFCRYLDLSRRTHWLLLHAALLVMIVNNAVQIQRFQEALQALS